MSTKSILLLLTLIISACSSNVEFINVICKKCTEDSFQQFPVLRELNDNECNICVLENTTSDTLKVASLRNDIPYFFNERRYKEGQNPNPYPAIGGFDSGTITYSIIIPPKGSYSFPIGSLMSSSRKYDKIEFEVRFLKKGKTYSEWIGCQI